jgi:putative FmdB family regulatory protein
VPIYDYTCAACGHLIEVIHGMREGGPRFCPSCGAEGTMRKGFAAPAVHFKGSGWAKKDRSATASQGRSRTSKPADDAGSGSGTGGSNSTGEASTSATAGTTTATSAADGGD